jgi:hypothetical protein
MRMLSTRIHGVLDYVMGLTLIALPFLADFGAGPQTTVMVGLGSALIIYSLCTNYELGLLDGISMRTHLTLDLLSGIFLAASPWIFGFADTMYMPHLLLGIGEIAASLLTRREVGADNVMSDRTGRVNRTDDSVIGGRAEGERNISDRSAINRSEDITTPERRRDQDQNWSDNRQGMR